MGNCTLDFAFANEEESFIIKEDVCGTLKKPVASSRIFTVGPVDFSQDQEFLPDEQIRATASKFSPIKGRKAPGDWGANTYIKPSGTLGAVPEHGVLFDCAMGNEQINGGVSVVYSLANQLDSFSYWFMKGHTVFSLRGCVVQGAELGIAGNEIAGASWSGQYMEQGWAGTINATGSYSGGESTINLPNGGAQLYTVGMYIEIGSDDNSGAGYRITEVNYTNDTLTISPNLVSGVGATPLITPWLPTASAEVGTPVHGKLGMVTIGGADAIVLTAGLTLTNNIKYYEDEKNNTWTAERFGRPKMRDVEGNLEMYFLRRGSSYWYRSEYQVSDALLIPAGNVAGYIMEISVPYAEYKTPGLTGDEEFVQNIPFMGIASSSGNDELEITFK